MRPLFGNVGFCFGNWKKHPPFSLVPGGVSVNEEKKGQKTEKETEATRDLVDTNEAENMRASITKERRKSKAISVRTSR
ncbi:hypothetical protein NL676_034937 [Syzygium grande]|nr:hypothetical protein NL676_034937 [Syzygium grande]